MSKASKTDKDFAKELSRYEDEWVAIKKEGRTSKIVASGKLATDVQRNAERKGAKNVVFMKVPSSKKVLIA